MSTYQETRREDAPAPEGTELCTHCKQRKPLSAFYADKNAAAHSFVRYDCKECSKAASSNHRKNGYRPPSHKGTTIRVGAGEVTQNGRTHSVTVVESPPVASFAPVEVEGERTVLVPQLPARESDMMTLEEWLELGEYPSVFAYGRIALYMLHKDAQGALVELLTTDGNGPRTRLNDALVRWSMKTLTHVGADMLTGIVYY